MKISIWFLTISLLMILTTSACSDNNEEEININTIQSSEKMLGLSFTDIERDSLLEGIRNLSSDYKKIRDYKLDNSVPPAFDFNPLPVGFKFEKNFLSTDFGLKKDVGMPENIDDLAFYTVTDLSVLIKNRIITSEQLTKIYLDRIKKYNSKLFAFITVTEELALQQAKQADKEISEGNYRGILHGIPYGVKDLLAFPDYKTTWGSAAHKEQIINQKAVVIQKLEKAGAVLLGKLSLGALAWGDVWFDGKTRNPWNTDQGSSGSSAGPASATSAGLVAFSIGSETWGSIVSPSTRCGTTGLRPTYGRVSRTGAMALSWSMDKLGPICRSANDCAIVFKTIMGTDGFDRTLIDLPFNYNADLDISNLKIGYIADSFADSLATSKTDDAVLQTFRDMGVELIEVKFPEGIPVKALSLILSAEAAAAFDELSLSNRDDLLVRQIKNAWPNVFREARFIPAVEYINANRIRFQLIEEMNQIMQKVDVVITPSFGGNQLLLTNLSGHPAMVVPNGFNENGEPLSITFLANLYDEATLIRVAKAYQDATDFDEKHPPEFAKN